MTREGAAVPTSIAPSAADEFVARLLATNDERRRSALIAHHNLSPEDLRTVVLALVEQALRIMGADPPRMEQLTLDAIALAESFGDPFLQAMAKMRYGDALRLQARYKDACVCYDGAAAVFAQIGCTVEAARTRIGWIVATAALGQPERALAAARKARRELAACGETALLAQLEVNTGTVYGNQGRLRPALRRFRIAQELFRSLGAARRPEIGRCYQNRGLLLGRLGRHGEALTELQFARETFEATGELAGVARVTRSIGEIQMDLGRYTAALRAFEAAGEMFGALGQNGARPMLALNTADCYLSLNRPDDALRILTAAEGQLRRRENAQRALGVATRRVAAHLMLGQREEARSVLDEVEHLFPDGPVQYRAWLAAQRAGLLVRDGENEEALAVSRRARSLARSGGLRQLAAEAWVHEGAALLALGRVDDARRAASCSQRIARLLDSSPLLHRAHELLGMVAEARGRTGTACRHYTTAIDQLQREQRGVIFEFRDSFAADRGRAYERLARLQLQAGRATEALATAERSKSRALADAIGGALELRPRGNATARRLMRELAKVREDYAHTSRSLAEAERNGNTEASERLAGRLAELESHISESIQRLQIASGDDAGDLYATAPAKLPELPAASALLEFYFSGNDVLRFLVDESGVRGDLLPDAVPELTRLLRTFRLNLDATEAQTAGRRGGLLTQARAVLARLYDRLLGDLPLDSYRSLVIVPQGPLHYLPFHALFDGERYLVERLAVSYAPSAAVYGACVSRRPRRSGALVLAHSDGGRLPFTLHEAEAVAGVLGVLVYTEAAAVRGLLHGTADKAAVVHIAAHGWFRPDAPLFSSIELADGPLTTADVFNLDLRAALVTLSACETGRAVLGGGDELVGMARAFLYAGAAGLLVSQWRVDDGSTAGLMERFYRELTRGSGKAEALRAAQMEHIASAGSGDDRSHPFFWAGFQIIGDNQGLRRRLHRAPRGGL